MKNLLISATGPRPTGRQVGMVSMWTPGPGQEDSLAAVTCDLFSHRGQQRQVNTC